MTEEQDKLESDTKMKVNQQQLEELSRIQSLDEIVENSDDEEDLDKLNLVHHVAVWSVSNDIKPMVTVLML